MFHSKKESFSCEVEAGRQQGVVIIQEKDDNDLMTAMGVGKMGTIHETVIRLGSIEVQQVREKEV